MQLLRFFSYADILACKGCFSSRQMWICATMMSPALMAGLAISPEARPSWCLALQTATFSSWMGELPFTLTVFPEFLSTLGCSLTYMARPIFFFDHSGEKGKDKLQRNVLLANGSPYQKGKTCNTLRTVLALPMLSNYLEKQLEIRLIADY